MAEKLQPTVVKIIENCELHNEIYKSYCTNHETPCCFKCQLEKHRKCEDIVALDDVVNAYGKSKRFTEIQMQLDYLAKTISAIKNDRQENKTKLNEQQTKIRKEIERFRENINAYLDKLNATITDELNDTVNVTTKGIDTVLKSIRKKEDEIIEMQNNIVTVVKDASDVQAFLYWKQTEVATLEIENFAQSLYEEGACDWIELYCNLSYSERTFQENLQSFGQISVNKKERKVSLNKEKHKQAQRLISLRSVENISLSPYSRLSVHGSLIYGCHITGPTLLFSSNEDSGKIVAVSKDGRKQFELDLYFPSAIASIDNTTIAVNTSGRNISIVDMEKQLVLRTIDINFKHRIDGLAYQDGTIIFCSQYNGIFSLKLDDETVLSIIDHNLSIHSCVATHNNKIYFTGGLRSNTVTCCDMKGTVEWHFENESILRDAQGITVDNDGNIYVVGSYTNNVLAISSDGKRFREVLSKYNGLNRPTVIHCDTTAKQILVSNLNGAALLYDIN